MNADSTRNIFFIFSVSLICSVVITSLSIDLAWHYALVKKILTDGGIRVGFSDYLREVQFLPPASHYLSAALAFLFTDPLQSMQFTGVFFTGLAWLTLNSFISRVEPKASVVFLFLIIFFALPKFFDLPIIGKELVDNYLFSQLIGTSVGLYLFFYVTKLKTDLRWDTLTLLIFFLLQFFHASFSIIFFASIFILRFSPPLFDCFIKRHSKRAILKTIFRSFAFGISGLVLFFTHPYTETARELKNHNGHIGFKYFTSGATDIAVLGHIFIFFIFLCALLLFVRHLSSRSHLGKTTQDPFFPLMCLFVATASITALQDVLFLFGILSAYIVKKNFFVLVTITLMMLAIISLRSATISKLSGKILNLIQFVPKGIQVSVGCLIFLAIVIRFWTDPRANYFDYLKYSKSVNLATTTFIPEKLNNLVLTDFTKVPMTLNFLFSVGDLRANQGALQAARIQPFLVDLPNPSYVLTDKIITSVEPSTKIGYFTVVSGLDYSRPPELLTNIDYQLSKDNAVTYVLLREGFAAPEQWGTWTSAKTATFQFAVGPDTREESLSAVFAFGAWIEEKHNKVKFEVFVNGKNVSEHEITRPHGNKITVPLFIEEAEKYITVSFVFDSDKSPQELGLSGDVRKLNLAFTNLKIVSGSGL